ncbi:hypothetical protein C8Q76DRAFT_689754 [Earliella scabrosa]|nr:hypothetical protein C8Q76DRAFT_689754 [Earliella scabrosa]
MAASAGPHPQSATRPFSTIDMSRLTARRVLTRLPRNQWDRVIIGLPPDHYDAFIALYALPGGVGGANILTYEAALSAMKSAGFFIVRSLDGDGAWLVPPGCGYDRYRRGVFLTRPNNNVLSQASKNRLRNRLEMRYHLTLDNFEPVPELTQVHLFVAASYVDPLDLHRRSPHPSQKSTQQKLAAACNCLSTSVMTGNAGIPARTAMRTAGGALPTRISHAATASPTHLSLYSPPQDGWTPGKLLQQGNRFKVGKRLKLLAHGAWFDSSTLGGRRDAYGRAWDDVLRVSSFACSQPAPPQPTLKRADNGTATPFRPYTVRQFVEKHQF